MKGGGGEEKRVGRVSATKTHDLEVRPLDRSQAHASTRRTTSLGSEPAGAEHNPKARRPSSGTPLNYFISKYFVTKILLRFYNENRTS